MVLPGVGHACFDDVDNVNLLSLLTEAGLTALTRAPPVPSLTPKTWLDRSLLQAQGEDIGSVWPRRAPGCLQSSCLPPVAASYPACP